MIGILLTLMMITAGVAITKMSTIGRELKEIAEQDIPLIEAITEITENQLEQFIWFERALRHGEKMAASGREAKAFEHAKFISGRFRQSNIVNLIQVNRFFG